MGGVLAPPQRRYFYPPISQDSTKVSSRPFSRSKKVTQSLDTVWQPESYGRESVTHVKSRHHNDAAIPWDQGFEEEEENSPFFKSYPTVTSSFTARLPM